MEDNRRYQRFPIELNGRCIGGSNDEFADCKIIDISREGIALKLYLKKKLTIDSRLVLEIDCPKNNEIISSVITIIWVEDLEHEVDFNYVAGGEFTMIEPDAKHTLLDYGYQNWLKQKKGSNKQL